MLQILPDSVAVLAANRRSALAASINLIISSFLPNLEDYAITYRTNRNAYLKAAYKAALDAYGATTTTYTKFLCE